MNKGMLKVVYLVIVVAMPEMMQLFDIVPPNEQFLELMDVMKFLSVCDQVVVAMKNVGSRCERENLSDSVSRRG